MNVKRSNHSTIEPLESRIAPAVFIVTNLNDSGTGSLRAELAAADAHGGSNTIVFHLPAPPVHGENIITLTSGALTTVGDVTITGPGAGKLIVSGNDSSGVFNITGQTGLTTISGLSIVDGNDGAGGGGIYCRESLTLKSVVISGNSTESGGGGVYVLGSTGAKVSISNSLISGNSAAANGGLGLGNLGSITISNTVVTGNTATNGAGGIAADVNGSGSGIAITDCRITGNRGPYGGLYLNGNSSAPAKIAITGTTISGNVSTSVSTSMGAGGGGLRLEYCNATIAGSTIRNNTAVYDGGGIDAANFTSLTISGSTISGNVTTERSSANYGGGGGVCLYGSGKSPIPQAKISGSVIADNRSSGAGGGVCAFNGVNLTISSSTISGNNAGAGGGVTTNSAAADQFDAVNLVMIGDKISNNSAYAAGGIDAMSGNGAVTIARCTMSGNFCEGATECGGAIYAHSAVSVTITNVVASGNIATGNGGAIKISNTSNFNISGGSFTGNVAGGYGGGIYTSDSAGRIVGVTISGNTAETTGGGVADAGGVVTLQVAKVSGNSAPGSPDVYTSDGGSFTYV